ncbi:reverse transcriptase (RNA-dependent DNA polymerase) domain-containing protein [Sarocladium implicatum]|nr:reverse transcriptase (RNA-dependent DNA polymerase) domain-containing protein [Sarocladium implicatum]
MEPKFHKVYALSPDKQQALKEYLEENLAKGYIRPSKSPAGYPILFIPKKNGKQQICVDFRQLNDITIKNRYPLPLIKELRDKLGTAQWFTALDLKGAYNLIRMKEGEEWKTAFRTREGLFEYLVMPFGLTNAPATFQEFINYVLREYLDIFVVVYLDDILIFSNTLEEHKKHVHLVLQTLQDNNTLVEPDKCEFHVQHIKFLGYKICPGEVRMDRTKLDTIRDWPRPTNVKEVQALLGPELNYPIHDKELMAIIEAFREWKHYLSGASHQVKVYTDHKNLTTFTTTKDLNKRQIRWSEFLSEFNFEIIYRKGSENGRADALSRREDLKPAEPVQLFAILRENADGGLELSTRQNNWVELLPIAQWAYNSSTNGNVGMSPFKANYGFNPSIDTYETIRTVPQAMRKATEMAELHKDLQKEWMFLQNRMKHYADKKRVEGPTLKKGDKAYLLRKNIRTKRPSNKLDWKKLGPFKIKRVVSKVNYELELPKDSGIHPVFHVSLLEPAPPNAELETQLNLEDERQYIVQKILNERRTKNGLEYLVK